VTNLGASEPPRLPSNAINKTKHSVVRAKKGQKDRYTAHFTFSLAAITVQKTCINPAYAQ